MFIFKKWSNTKYCLVWSWKTRLSLSKCRHANSHDTILVSTQTDGCWHVFCWALSHCDLLQWYKRKPIPIVRSRHRTVPYRTDSHHAALAVYLRPRNLDSVSTIAMLLRFSRAFASVLSCIANPANTCSIAILHVLVWFVKTKLLIIGKRSQALWSNKVSVQRRDGVIYDMIVTQLEVGITYQHPASDAGTANSTIPLLGKGLPP